MPSHPEVTIVADSINHNGNRLVSFETLHHHFIHPEILTHRMFGRNASSLRATPTRRLLRQVWNDPWMPLHYGKNQSGMQANEELSPRRAFWAREAWKLGAKLAVGVAWSMMRVGAHKQIANRVLGPFLPVRMIITGTDWANFFALRRHPDAQPEIRALADAMYVAMQKSTPVLRHTFSWHLPYVTEEERATLDPLDAIKVSVARCARVSYRLHDGQPSTIEKDLALYERLVGSDPKHASPTEHQACPMPNPLAVGLYQGWRLYRHLLVGESVHTPKNFLMENIA